MPRVVTHRNVDRAALDAILAPREDLVAERAEGKTSFVAVDGPVREYRRTVRVEPTAGDRFEVEERIEFRLAMPFWGLVAVLPFKRALRRRRSGQPWWAPPARLDARAAGVLGVLCTASLVAGYLGTLLTQTITFASDEFGASDTAQGATLAAVRASIVLALVLVAAADRWGRRPLIVVAVVGGCLVAATGALTPSLVWLGVSQTAARGFSITLGLLITIVAAEEMPRGSRAYGISILAMVAGLGAGMAVWVLPVADLGESAWRIVYLVPLLGLLTAPLIARTLPESRRFAAPHDRVPMRGHGRRLAMLAAAAFFVQLLAAPSSQLQNEFLRDDREYSAALISLFTVVTTTPVGIGVFFGGRLADLRGRRVVGAVGLVGGSIFTVLMYTSAGWGLWAWGIAQSMVAGLTVPALGVYGPELFPTSLRGRANGVLSILAVLGAATGLVTAGLLSEHLFDSLGPAIAVMSVGPLVTAAIVLLAFPETAHRELEDINPEDAPLAPTLPLA